MSPDSSDPPWPPLADALEREVRARLLPLRGDMAQAIFEQLIDDIVEIKIKYLVRAHSEATSAIPVRADSEATSAIPDSQPTARPSLAHHLGTIRHAPRPSAIPPRSTQR